MAEAASQCGACATAFGFIFNRRTSCPLCTRSLCTKCVAFPISPMDAKSSAKVTACWNCVLENYSKRHNKFTSTPRPESGKLPVFDRLKLTFVRFFLKRAGFIEGASLDDLSFEGKYTEGPLACPADGVVVTEIDGLPTSSEGVTTYVRIYRPISEPSDVALPALVFIHGGGWTVGNARALPQDTACRQISKFSRFSVISVEYRLAPRHPFPVPVEDSFAVYRYICENPQKFNIDPMKICVGGDSAGGNMSCAICIMAAERNVQKPAMLIDIYGVHDPPHAGKTESWALNLPGCMLEVAGPIMIQSYLKGTDPVEREKDARLRPLLAAQSADAAKIFPPTLCITGGFDPLLDDGLHFARALAANADPNYKADSDDGANSLVTSISFGQSFHGFVGMGAESVEAQWAISIALRERFGLDPVKQPQ